MNASESLRQLLNVNASDEPEQSVSIVSAPVRRVSPAALELVANVAGRCALNGAPAKLEQSVTKSGRRIVRIVRLDHSDSAVFNWGVADFVLRRRCGCFETK